MGLPECLGVIVSVESCRALLGELRESECELDAGELDLVMTELERFEDFSGEWKKLEMRERDMVGRTSICSHQIFGRGGRTTEVVLTHSTGVPKRMRRKRTDKRRILLWTNCFYSPHKHKWLNSSQTSPDHEIYFVRVPPKYQYIRHESRKAATAAVPGSSYDCSRFSESNSELEATAMKHARLTKL
jgi:hypothetical protein